MDSTSASAQQEFSRKARTIAGCFQLFARERWLLDPRQNRLWFATLSHKGLRLTLPLAIGVATLVLMVVFSYIQTILHYPDGGGAYTVAKDNLGTMPSLLAGGATCHLLPMRHRRN